MAFTTPINAGADVTPQPEITPFHRHHQKSARATRLRPVLPTHRTTFFRFLSVLFSTVMPLNFVNALLRRLTEEAFTLPKQRYLREKIDTSCHAA